jgi:hypothetical protein
LRVHGYTTHISFFEFYIYFIYFIL